MSRLKRPLPSTPQEWERLWGTWCKAVRSILRANHQYDCTAETIREVLLEYGQRARGWWAGPEANTDTGKRLYITAYLECLIEHGCVRDVTGPRKFDCILGTTVFPK